MSLQSPCPKGTPSADQIISGIISSLSRVFTKSKPSVPMDSLSSAIHRENRITTSKRSTKRSAAPVVSFAKVTTDFLSASYPHLELPDLEMLRNEMAPGDLVKVHVDGLGSSGVRTARLREDLDGSGTFLAVISKIGDAKRKAYVGKVHVSNIVEVIEHNSKPEKAVKQFHAIGHYVAGGGGGGPAQHGGGGAAGLHHDNRLNGSVTGGTFKFSRHNDPKNWKAESPSFQAKAPEKCWVKDDNGLLIHVQVTDQTSECLWGKVIGACDTGKLIYVPGQKVTFAKSSIIVNNSRKPS